MTTTVSMVDRAASLRIQIGFRRDTEDRVIIIYGDETSAMGFGGSMETTALDIDIARINVAALEDCVKNYARQFAKF